MATEDELRIDANLIATPDAWKGVDKALAEVVKIPMQDKGIVHSQLVVGDLRGVTTHNLEFETIPGDLRIIERAVVEKPDRVRRLIHIYTASNGDPESIDFYEVDRLLSDLNLNEVSSTQAGGGMLPLLVLALILAASCAHCSYACRDKD
ncbi:hypothetical protein ACFXKC_45470 [Streptomyces sp. NPDC059340]|uniref:hypothetical protein n=1 Tax=Streptomyces sp. NPDC059340 TaxID=3346806 RepID=UPI0036C342F5